MSAHLINLAVVVVSAALGLSWLDRDFARALADQIASSLRQWGSLRIV
jgi:hypothetical protein